MLVRVVIADGVKSKFSVSGSALSVLVLAVIAVGVKS